MKLLQKYRKPRSSKALATLLANIASEKLTEDVVVLNLKKIETAPTDYFVICTCNTDIHARAVADTIYKYCKELKIQYPRIEGLEYSHWILLDFLDVVMHIMLKEERLYYHLEKLWGDASFFKLDKDGNLLKI